MNLFFKISERGSSVGREVLAGLVTFMAMAYILCIQPQIMSGEMFGNSTGMDSAALLTTTCLVAAFGCFLMGFWANYPIALAPGMGENIFVVLTVIPACAALLGKNPETQPWQLALGVVFVSGVIFAILSFLNLRRILVDAISPSLRGGMTAGIGMLIALIGLQQAEIIVCKNNLYVLGLFNTLTENYAPLIFVIGLVITVSFRTLNIRGSILYGIIAAAAAALLLGKISLVSPFGLPADPMPVVAQLDVSSVFRHFNVLLPLILILVFMDMFDTLGTVVGVGSCAGLIKDHQHFGIERVFAADATATVVGAVGGHSTVTAYIESMAGVETGGRTGLTAVATGVMFLFAMFFAPFFMMIAKYPPITSAALVTVGALMLQGIAKIRWDDPSESVPAFLILIGIPFSYSIADGMILGLVLYPIIKFFSAKGSQISWVMYVLAAALIAYLLFVIR